MAQNGTMKGTRAALQGAGAQRSRTARSPVFQTEEGKSPFEGQANPLEGKGPMREKIDQMRHLHDFLNNPTPFDLKDEPLTTSSSAEEIEERRAELTYQSKLLRSLLSVIEDELKKLERVTPEERRSRTPRSPIFGEEGAQGLSAD